MLLAQEVSKGQVEAGSRITDLGGKLDTRSQVACDYLGQPPPGATPQVFARGIVSTDHLEHSAPAFSPDGNEVFWSLWRWPDKGEPQVIMTMRRESGTWSVPTVAPFSGKFVDGGPVFSPDGKRLYFGSADAAPPPSGGSRVYDIVYVEKTGNGWSERRSLGLLTVFPELKSVSGPSFTRNGTLYFTGYTPGPLNDYGIYRTELANGEYAKPELLPRSINLPPFLNWTPFIAPDESYLLFSSDRRDPSRGDGDLYISRLADGSWTDPVSLGEPINTDRMERFPMLSRDGQYLFFTRWTPDHDHDVYWVDARSVLPIQMAQSSISRPVSASAPSRPGSTAPSPAIVSSSRPVPAESTLSLDHCIVAGNKAAGLRSVPKTRGRGLVKVNKVNLNQCRLIQNGGYGLGGDGITVANSILYSNGDMQIKGNNLYVSYSDVQGGFAGQESIDTDPLFAAAGTWTDPNTYTLGDYHLKSQVGHWNLRTCTWVLDDTTNAGNPSAAFDREPVPHGSRANLGAYGGTAEASRTPAE